MHSSRDAVSQVVCCALQTKKKNEFDPETIPWVKRGVNESWSYSLDSIQFADPSIVISQKRKNIFHWNMPSTLSFGAWTIPMLPEANNEGNWQATIGDNDTFFRMQTAGVGFWIIGRKGCVQCTGFQTTHKTNRESFHKLPINPSFLWFFFSANSQKIIPAPSTWVQSSQTWHLDLVEASHQKMADSQASDSRAPWAPCSYGF